MSVSNISATEKCESILRKSLEYNIEHSILPSENTVIHRLLEHRENMVHVYSELVLSLNNLQIDVILSLILSCAAFWNPEKAALYRTEKKELIDTNLEIKKVAISLSKLLERREQLHNESGFSSNTHYSIMRVIDKAGKNNGLYEMYLQKPLEQLRGQFDLKYWPGIEEVIYELAIDAGNTDIYASDLLTKVTTDSSKPSRFDFLCALIVAIKENTGFSYNLLPLEFKLTDRAVAEIMNCTLDLDVEKLVDSAYIKRARQRLRNKPTVNA